MLAFTGSSHNVHSFAKSFAVTIATKYLRAQTGLFSPNLNGQSSCRILITHEKTRPMLQDDWSTRLGENRSDQTL